MLSINDFLLEYKRKCPNILMLWMIVLVFIILFLITINKDVKFKSYYQVQGVVKNQNVMIYTLIQDLDKIVYNNKFYINNIEYTYNIKMIKEDTVVSNGNFYKEVYLSTNLDSKYLIDNNLLQLKFIVKEMTIFEYIINLIKGE